MECTEKLGMSVKKIQHLREGPCGIAWYSNLTRELLLDPVPKELSEPEAGHSDCGPLNRKSARKYILDAAGYCINLSGGVYHYEYGIAFMQNAYLWAGTGCPVTKLLSDPAGAEDDTLFFISRLISDPTRLDSKKRKLGVNDSEDSLLNWKDSDEEDEFAGDGSSDKALGVQLVTGHMLSFGLK